MAERALLFQGQEKEKKQTKKSEEDDTEEGVACDWSILIRFETSFLVLQGNLF